MCNILLFMCVQMVEFVYLLFSLLFFFAGGRLMFGIEDDGKVVGVPLDRSQRDAIRLAIDSLIVEPDCSHLIELVLSPVSCCCLFAFVVLCC
jgi:hypothetical protein